MRFDDSQVSRTQTQNASSAGTYLDTSHITAGQTNSEYTYNGLELRRVATLEALTPPAETSPSRATRRAHNRRLARARAKRERSTRTTQVTQLAQATDSQPVQCEFDSHLGHTHTPGDPCSASAGTDSTTPVSSQLSIPSPTDGDPHRHCDTPPVRQCGRTSSPRLSYARRRANLGRHRLIPRFATAITSLFTTTHTPHHNHNQAQNDDQDPTTGNHDSDGDVHGPDLPDPHTRALAAGINLLINTTARARSAWSIRGELAAWQATMPTLPTDFDDAVDTLTIYQDRLIDQLHHDWANLAPTIDRLNHNQPSPTCWARPARTPVTDTWTGRAQWITHACNHLDHTMHGPSMACSPANRHALVTALAHSAQPNGHNLTAAHRTIAERAITTYGCTLSLSTATQRLRTIRRLLTHAGLHHIDAHGGHLTSEERLAAYTHHGHRQTRCANTAHLTLPNHLRPTPQPRSPRPAYAHGLNHRLAAREAAQVRKSTYSYTHRLSSSLGSHRGAHERAVAREQQQIPHSEASQGPSGHPTAASHNTNTTHTPAPTGHTGAHACPDTPTPRRKTPSLRAWRIADDLTRTVDGSAAANGPYAALVGPGKNQCRLITLARLIDTHTPTWAGTRDVMRAIAHHATSHTTGFIALGLPRHRAELPHNPTGWLTSVFTRLDFTNPEQFPTWTRTADAFGVTWNGTRHHWTPIG